VSALFGLYGLGMAASGAVFVLLGARLGRLVRDELRRDLDRYRRELARARRELAEAREPAPVPEEAREPELSAPLPAADATEAPSPFAAEEEGRLFVLAEWARGASPGAAELGARLADRLRWDVPDLKDADLARVMLSAGAYLQEAAGLQDDDAGALRAVTDAILGAPPALAELDLALAERGQGR
jgi:hypothetical protein